MLSATLRGRRLTHERIEASPSTPHGEKPLQITRTNHYQFRITVENLSTLAVSPTLGGTNAVWLVRWEVPDPNGAGHTYFAGMESDGGAAPSFFDGETSSINTTHGKFLTYPRAHSIQGSYTPNGPGVITLTVPIGDVGGNSRATMYSITGLSGDTIFNQIDSTAPFDLKP